MRIFYGGEVVIDAEDDELLDNALEEIQIRVIQHTNGEVTYKKSIHVRQNDEKGYITDRDYETGRVHQHYVDRGQIEQLVDRISHIFGLTARKSDYSVRIRHGDREWSSDIGAPLKRSQKRVQNQSDIYSDIVTNILSFEGQFLYRD